MKYDIILADMKDKFTSLAGFEPDDASDIGIRLKVIAGEFLAIYNQIEFTQNQIFPQTASDSFLELHGKNRNIFPLDAKKSRGEIVFSRISPATSDILIPTGTLVSCSSIKDSPVYLTDFDCYIRRGESAVAVFATASKGGASSNIAINKIDTIVSSLVGVSSVSNPKPFSGGFQKESIESFRKRILNTFVSAETATNLSFFEKFALQNPIISSSKAINSPNANIITLYITDKNRSLPTQILDQISAEIQKYRPINTSIIVKKPTNIAVNCDVVVYSNNSVSEYETTNSAYLAIEKYISELNIGEFFSPFNLAPYILAIPNIVDYKFISPTAPLSIAMDQCFIPNRINVSYERR